LAEQLVFIYQQMIESSDVSNDELSFLPKHHEDTVLQWSRGAVKESRFASIAEAFDFYVRTQADNVALELVQGVDNSEDNAATPLRLTYKELNDRANQLGHFLLDDGVVYGDLVGLCIEKGVEQIVSIVACLKLGCSVVPMDPCHPTVHLSRIIESTECAVILTNGEHLHKVSESAIEVALIDWHADAADIALCSNHDIDFSPSPASAAYVVHTSGSSGIPKGVVVSQSALQNYVEGIESRLALPAQASLSALSSVAADLGYTAVFGALGSGRCLRLITEATGLDPELLALELRNHPVDCLKIVPSHLAALLTSTNAADILPTSSLILGGESLDAELLELLKSMAPRLRILNHYGPTEATIGISCGDIEIDSIINVGTPIENTCCYVLNENFELAGIGIEGDLFLAGDGLSDGYHGAPVSTAAAFVPLPSHLSLKPGQRMYQSGDRAYYDSTGKIIFVGRKDHQVKIRGHRIELDGIVGCIRQKFPDQILTVDVKQVNEESRLIAYLVDPAVPLSEIQDYLKSQLPSPMQPHFWLEIPQLPRSVNGKLDKKKLPLPQFESVDLSDTVSAETLDTNPVQDALLSILRDLLGQNNIGLRDNFFTLGGDSIVAIQLVARAKQHGLKISPKQVLDFPTILGLAEVATELDSEKESVGREPKLNVSFKPAAIQKRFFQKVDIQPNQYNQSTILELTESVTPCDIKQCVAELLKVHDMLRLRLQKSEMSAMGWQQTIVPYSEELLEKSYIRKSLTDSSKPTQTSYSDLLAKAIRTEQAGFELEGESLVRFVWFDGVSTDQEQHPSHLFIVAHHLIVDAVSWSVLEFDLKTLYQQVKTQLPLNLPHKTHSYPYWVEKTHDLFAKLHWHADIAYWSQVIKNQTILPVDTALIATHNRVCDASNKVKLLPATLLSDIQSHVNPSINTRTEDLLLTALSYAFSAWTGQFDLSVMMEANGRDISSLEHDSSRTVGWFTSIYPVNLSINSEHTYIENLRLIKDQLLAVPESGFSYGVLKYADDELSGSDLDGEIEPQISFNYFGRLFAQQDKNSEIRSSEYYNLAQIESRALDQNRTFLVDVVMMDTDQGLVVNLVYPPNLISDSTVQTILDSFESTLVDLVQQCHESEVVMTPSDFVDVSLTQSQIDHLFETNRYSPQDIENAYPATQVQTGILFHSLTMEGTGVYVPQHALEINLPLNVDAFKAAWQRLVTRYAPFRTGFANLDSEVPLQIVVRDAVLNFLELDWTQGLSSYGHDLSIEGNVELAFKQLLEEQWLAPFDLAKAPLMRMSLVRISRECYRFIWTYHHAVIDGWSGPIILRELFSIYDAICSDTKIELPATSSFVEYIRWLRKQDEGEARAFWKQQIQGFRYGKQLSEVLRPDTKGSQRPGKFEVARQLSEKETRALRDFTRQQGVTLSVVCQAAWALLLYRYTQEKDMIFGVTVSGRPAAW